MARKIVAPLIIEYAAQHPRASYDEVAAGVGCKAALVRATFYRHNIPYTPAKYQHKGDARSEVQRLRDAVADAVRYLKTGHAELALSALITATHR